jgi:hypothetical protein
MPTLTELVTAATDFISTYAVFIAGGAVMGLGAYALGRLVKGAR